LFGFTPDQAITTQQKFARPDHEAKRSPSINKGVRQMTRPTYQDATLMVQLAQWWSTSGAIEAMSWLLSDEYIPDYDAFVAKYPPGSEGYGKVAKVLMILETLGTLYKHELFNEELLFDWLAVGLVWNRLKGFVLGYRAAYGSRMYENFEAMAKAQPEM
jgi:hypothetical protein